MIERNSKEKACRNYGLFLFFGFLAAVVSVQANVAIMAAAHLFAVFLFNGVERSGVSLSGEAKAIPTHYIKAAPWAALDTIAILSGAFFLTNFISDRIPALSDVSSGIGFVFSSICFSSSVFMAFHLFGYMKKSLLPENT
ncbi:hypothetical protein [Sulfitobacter sp. R18_1]|uniref:hypothetical protein n=1 Tax=Sulfitobacter sp. R18_1 TaxID=2821104 RepID=UPI001ADCCAE8|nr:hypothetical protein [Sulfitobacter sp. R18_1]MBO9428296.1 hypothetical protein [Sulfitobacter sp. R18_1]